MEKLHPGASANSLVEVLAGRHHHLPDIEPMSLQIWVIPGEAQTETNHPHCALSDLLTNRSHTNNKIVVFLSPRMWDGLLASSILCLLEIQTLRPRLVSVKSDCILLKSLGNIYVHLSLRGSDTGHYKAPVSFLIGRLYLIEWWDISSSLASLLSLEPNWFQSRLIRSLKMQT